MTDKRLILDALLNRLEAEATELLSAAETTRSGATHAEARPENSKDTRALEASYLARGQAQRVEEVNELITRLRFLDLPNYGEDEVVGPAALVEVEIDGDRIEHLFLVPAGGGHTVEVDGRTIRVITIASPVGRGLLGKEVGDDFKLTIVGKSREYVIESLS
ncbi:MAG: GreA/GreB family elongation factor [Deltaproteobacteria bacterium]|nr:GreA/GreB family elongation factor [Deltaproteobacteria bacterium]